MSTTSMYLTTVKGKINNVTKLMRGSTASYDGR